MKPIKSMRQGDVILQATQDLPDLSVMSVEKRCDLVLARGEVTGHTHRITQGEAELYQWGINLCLRVYSQTAILTHEEHQSITIPKGDWLVTIQREYEPRGWRRVVD
ncbi:MAG: hypothetical protein KFF72_00915 [Arthrospira sp. SH-MAG29]|nr:hypothetical protein [Arthrospira sp. SH-MAG29]MBS0014926.1 hypothetical protein [Arthrospira sp. SH-MAG29]